MILFLFKILFYIITLVHSLLTRYIAYRIGTTGEIFSALIVDTTETFFCFSITRKCTYFFEMDRYLLFFFFLLIIGLVFPILHTYFLKQEVKSLSKRYGYLLFICFFLFILEFLIAIIFDITCDVNLFSVWLFFRSLALFVLTKIFHKISLFAFFQLTLCYVLFIVYFSSIAFVTLILICGERFDLVFFCISTLFEYSDYTYYFPPPVIFTDFGYSQVIMYPEISFDSLEWCVHNVMRRIQVHLSVPLEYRSSAVFLDLKRVLLECLLRQRADLANENINIFLTKIYPSLSKPF